VIPWDQFLVWVTAFGNCGADDQLVWIALDELGLADKDAFTGAEMLAIEHAVGVLIQSGLESSTDPKAKAYAKLMANANQLFTKYGSPD
jgi:hypothetical protein